MRFLASEVRFVDYNDAAYSGERASYTASRMNSMLPEEPDRPYEAGQEFEI